MGRLRFTSDGAAIEPPVKPKRFKKIALPVGLFTAGVLFSQAIEVLLW